MGKYFVKHIDITPDVTQRRHFGESYFTSRPPSFPFSLVSLLSAARSFSSPGSFKGLRGVSLGNLRTPAPRSTLKNWLALPPGRGTPSALGDEPQGAPRYLPGGTVQGNPPPKLPSLGLSCGGDGDGTTRSRPSTALSLRVEEGRCLRSPRRPGMRASLRQVRPFAGKSSILPRTGPFSPWVTRKVARSISSSTLLLKGGSDGVPSLVVRKDMCCGSHVRDK